MKKLFNRKAPYLFVAPAFILLVIFSFSPILIALGVSFTDMNLAGLADFSKVEFIGLTNYTEILKDEIFIKSFFNTVVYVIFGVPLIVIISLTLAILINHSTHKIFSVFKVVFYSPSITNVVAVAVVWAYIYNPQIGLLNTMLTQLGIGPVNWLTDPAVAKYSLIVLGVWRAVGINMIIFLAALQGISKDLYEAADLDGANSRQKVFNITIPSLKFAIFFVMITTLIGWVQFFEEPLIMTQGGPMNSTMSIAYFIYKTGFQLNNFGYAAAGSFILFAILIVVTTIQFRLQNKKEQ